MDTFVIIFYLTKPIKSSTKDIRINNDDIECSTMYECTTLIYYLTCKHTLENKDEITLYSNINNTLYLDEIMLLNADRYECENTNNVCNIIYIYIEVCITHARLFSTRDC